MDNWIGWAIGTIISILIAGWIYQDANARGTTVVVATHDRRLIENSHKRLVSLIKGDIVEQVDPQEEDSRKSA